GSKTVSYTRFSGGGRATAEPERWGPGMLEQSMLNRGVVIVRPKQLYVNWAAELDDSGVVPDGGGDKTIYLIPSFETPSGSSAPPRSNRLVRHPRGARQHLAL